MDNSCTECGNKIVGYHNCYMELTTILCQNFQEVNRKKEEAKHDNQNILKMINDLKNIK